MAEVTLLHFDKDGNLKDGVAEFSADVTDIVLISHGWNETQADAIQHYQSIVDPLDRILSQNSAQWQGRKSRYFGVIWPAAKYADDLTVLDMQINAGTPPALEATTAQPATITPLSDAALQERASDVAWFIGADPAQIVAHALSARSHIIARDALMSALRGAVVDRRQNLADQQTQADHANIFSDRSGSQIFSGIADGLRQLRSDFAQKSDNPLIDWLNRLRTDANAIIANILNIFAYNEMKIRAGVVGTGLAQHVLDRLRTTPQLRVHLVGHSFGGRVVTSAANTAQRKIDNLTLLEGAFSQNALSKDVVGGIDGAFRQVVDNKKVLGRLIAGHSDHDAAVWIAYPRLSRLPRQLFGNVSRRATRAIIWRTGRPLRRDRSERTGKSVKCEPFDLCRHGFA